MESDHLLGIPELIKKPSSVGRACLISNSYPHIITQQPPFFFFSSSDLLVFSSSDRFSSSTLNSVNA